MPTNSKRAIALARSAGALVGTPFIAPRDGEAANAFVAFNAECVKHNLDPASTYADASTADPVRKHRAPASPKPAASEAPKPDAKPEAPKADKPAKPATGSPNADAYAERVKIIDALRDAVSGLYNGPSLAVRSNPKRVAASVYAELLASPKHRTTLAKISVRDESALFLIIKRGERNGSFDPINLNLDSGIFSRLASVGFIIGDGPDAYKLSDDAMRHARGVAKRAATAAKAA